jgi:hypothetical protein
MKVIVTVHFLWLALSTSVAFAAQAGAPASRNAAGSDLSARLGDLLRNLDHDQSRKLTRQIEPSQSAYAKLDLAQVGEALESHNSRATIVLGKRGPLADSPLEVDEIVAVSASKSAPKTGTTSSKARSRWAYVPNAKPHANWSALLQTPQAKDRGELTTTAAMEKLAKSRSAAFVFLLSANGNSVEKLILVPDTVMINVTGSAVAAPETSRRSPAYERSPPIRPEPPHRMPPGADYPPMEAPIPEPPMQVPDEGVQ